MSLRGTLDHIPIVDEALKREGLRGLLVGGLGHVFHIAQRNRERAAAILPRKDTDVLIVDAGREDVVLDEVDTFRRHTYRGDWRLDCFHETAGRFPYWRNRHAFLDVSFPNIDKLDLEPGLHIPDEVFLMRMLARWQMVSAMSDLYNRRLPPHLENADPIFHRGLFSAKFRRALRGDPEGTVSMDEIQVRPLTSFEKYCLSCGYDVSYPRGSEARK